MTGGLNRAALAAAISALVAGCVNMATPPSRIAGVHVSSLKYEMLDCARLSVEANYLARREILLVAAQEERVANSDMQAYWFRFGQGDGREAAELAIVRGEKDAVRQAMAAKRC